MAKRKLVDRVQESVDEAVEQLDQATAPDRLSKKAAIDALERIIEACRSRIEALRDEIKETD